jgi:phosphoglycerol transferase
MDEVREQPNRLKSVAGYAAAACLSLLAVFLVMKLWRADLRVPLLYDTDGPYTLAWIKGVIDNGWYLHNPYLGAPAGHEHEDFPLVDSLHFLILKAIALFTHDASLVHNIYYLLTFPLAALTSLFVLRHFKVSFLPALAAGLLYAFIPGHFFRLGHLFLAAYYLLPLIVMVTLWVYLSEPPVISRTDSGRARLCLWNGKALASMVICLLVSSAGVYYAFFACFFLIVAGLAGTLTRRSLAPLALSALLGAVIGGGVLGNLVPTILYTHRHGPNPDVAKRTPSQTELYGLKIAPMLLPTQSHRITALAKLRDSYDTGMPVLTENGFATLGLVSALGFVLLVARLLYRPPTSNRLDLCHALAILNVFAVLLGEVGGFGSLFGFLVSPQIRCYNRISMYIAFFALFAIALLWDKAHQLWFRSRWQRALAYSGFCAVVVLGVLDQTSKLFVPPHALLQSEFYADAAFVRQIEDSMPGGAMIYQLPYLPFPEGGRRELLFDYEQCKPYLHSKALRWSYGAMKGRDGDLALRAIANRSVEEMVDAATLAGFSGLCIDRLGYADRGAGLEARLSSLLDEPPLVNANQKRCFFSLLEHRQRLQHAMSAQDWEKARQRVLHPVAPHFRHGFFLAGGLPESSAHWCSPRAMLALDNPLPESRAVVLHLELAVSQLAAHLTLQSDLWSATYEFHNGRLVLDKKLTISPGSHPVRLTCDAQRVYAPGEPHVLVFLMEKFQLRELD